MSQPTPLCCCAHSFPVLTTLVEHQHRNIPSTLSALTRCCIFTPSRIAQGIYRNLRTNGLLEKQDKEQVYCEGCPKYGPTFTICFEELTGRRFLADRFVEGICPHCGYEDARGDQCDLCSRTLDAVELVKPR